MYINDLFDSLKFMLLYLTVLRSTKGPDAPVSLSVSNTMKPGNTFNLTFSLSLKTVILVKLYSQIIFKIKL